MSKNNYEAMTNQELLEAAKKKRVILSSTDSNRLNIIRGVENDRQGLVDRQAFIVRLNAFDSIVRSNCALYVSIASFAVALFSVYIALVR